MKGNATRQQKTEFQCSICFSRSANTTLDGCTHLFCIRCIKKWAKAKNTCPLCRQEFLILKYKKRQIQITPPPQPQRFQRIVTQQQPVQQRRIIYFPLIIYPQTNCFIYNPTSNLFSSLNMNQNSGSNFSMGSSFFIPSL